MIDVANAAGDGALLLMSVVGLAATAMAIVRDARTDRVERQRVTAERDL